MKHPCSLLAAVLLGQAVLASPAWANYQAPPVAVRIEGDASVGLLDAMIQGIGTRPRFRYWPSNSQSGDRESWLNQLRQEGQQRNAPHQQGYALVIGLSRGPMNMGTPKEESREVSRGKSEQWLVGTLEQELRISVQFIDLSGKASPLAPFMVNETMRRKFEIELTKLNDWERRAKGVELGLRLGTEMRRPPNQVFASILPAAAQSLANACLQRVAGLALFKLHAEVSHFNPSSDRATIPIGSEVGVEVGDSMVAQSADGQSLGHFRIRSVAAQSSLVQPIFWAGPMPLGMKLLESGRGGSWLSAQAGAAYFGSPMFGGSLRLSAEASRLWKQCDGYFIMEGSSFLGAKGHALWGGVGIGGREFLRATSLGWKALGGALLASPLTGNQAVPALSLGLGIEQMIRPGFSIGLEASPFVAWPVQLPGSTQSQIPFGASAQLGLHLIF